MRQECAVQAWLETPNQRIVLRNEGQASHARSIWAEWSSFSKLV